MKKEVASLISFWYISGMKNNYPLGAGIPVLLTVAFVVLKLCKVISWSWWWVLSPTWIYVALTILFGLLLLKVVKR